MELDNLTAISALERLKTKSISCRELVEFFLEKIETENPKINAFLTVCRDEALGQAKEIDEEIAKNGSEAFIGKPLLGLPIALKDIFSTKGVKTTAASKVLENYIPSFDATVVSKLKTAGAIILGKTNLDAWAHGSSGENSAFGPTKNPHDLTRVSGGSSSGSGAAVGANLVLGATGTDTGGSIRLPASFCGVVGLKPTYGRVSRYGIIAMASSFDSIGHLTKTVADSALILGVTAGKDPRDATTLKEPVGDYLKVLEQKKAGLKIGLPKEFFSQEIDPKVKSLISEKAKRLEKRGFTLKEVSLSLTPYALPAYYIIQSAEVSSNLARFDGIRFGNGRDAFGAEAKRRIMLGTYTLSAGYYEAYYLKAMKVRTLICQEFEKVFDQVDLLLGPVSPSLPFKLGEKMNDPIKMYLSDVLNVPVNLAGLPALSIPVGQVDNLPVGAQLIGPQLSEEKLFQVGRVIEEL